MSELEDAQKKLDKEYQQIRDDFSEIHEAFDKVISAGPTDEIHDLLLDLEKVVKDVRDGGLLFSGSNGHRRALKAYREAGGE